VLQLAVPAPVRQLPHLERASQLAVQQQAQQLQALGWP
jgi:hypothetical protein